MICNKMFLCKADLRKLYGITSLLLSKLEKSNKTFPKKRIGINLWSKNEIDAWLVNPDYKKQLIVFNEELANEEKQREKRQNEFL